MKGFSHLKSWVLEGCGSSGKWVELDSRDDNYDLNGKNKQALFNCVFNAYCNQVRLRQTGPNHHGDDYLVITNIEFFGDWV
jgi:hypothetical protein